MARTFLLQIVASFLVICAVQGQNQSQIAQIWTTLSRVDPDALLKELAKLSFADLPEGLRCLTELTDLYHGLNSANLSSIYWFDAQGKPGSGVLKGNLMMLGNYDTCQSLKEASNSHFEHCKSAAHLMITGYPTAIPLTWTGCLPKPCQGAGFDKVVTEILLLIPQLENDLAVVNFDTKCEVIFEYDAGAYVAVMLCSLLVFLVIVGSLWQPIRSLFKDSVFFSNDGPGVDWVNSMIWKDEEEQPLIEEKEDMNNRRISVHEVKLKEQRRQSNTPESTLGRILQCFSLQLTLPALLSTDTKEGHIHCLNGIRFLSINWVVLGHTYELSLPAAGDPAYVYKDFLHTTSSSLITNGLPSVDSFFVLSGFLVSYLLLKDLAKNNGKFRFVGYYLHRYIRLTIPYGIIMLIEGWLYPIYITGNFPEAFTKEHETCSQYWWTNLLYINNLYPWNICNMVCMGQTWYLSNDMQFFCLAPIFVYLLWKSPIAGHVLSQCAIWCSAIAAGVITYHYGFGPTLFTDTTDDNYFRYLYTAPWVRCTPYLVGILGGWTYWSFSEEIIEWGKRQNSWKKLGLGAVVWVSTIAVQYCVVFGVHCLWIYPEFSTVAKSVSYESLARIAWSIALTVQIFACQAGLGGWVNTCLTWNWLQPFSRLTYGVYLLHFGIVTALITQLRHPFYYQTDFEVIVIYIGILAISYAASVLLYLFVEQPIMFLERISYRKS